MNKIKTHALTLKPHLKLILFGMIFIGLGLTPLIVIVIENKSSINEEMTIALMAGVFPMLVGLFILRKAAQKVTIFTDGLTHQNILGINQKLIFKDVSSITLSVGLKDQVQSPNHSLQLIPLNDLKKQILLRNDSINNLNIAVLIARKNQPIVNINPSTFTESELLIQEIEQFSQLSFRIINPENDLSTNLSTLKRGRNKFFRFKYLLLTPIVLWLCSIVYLHVWFNFTHYQFSKHAENSQSNQLFTLIANKPIKDDRYPKARILSHQSNDLILDAVVFEEKDFWGDEVDLSYRYSWYPFESPYYFARIINLDQDPEPEIIQRKDSHSNDFFVLDYDPKSDQFIQRPLQFFSTKYVTYLNELRGHKYKKISFNVVYNASGIVFIYLFFMGLIRLLIWANKQKTKL